MITSVEKGTASGQWVTSYMQDIITGLRTERSITSTTPADGLDAKCEGGC